MNEGGEVVQGVIDETLEERGRTSVGVLEREVNTRVDEHIDDLRESGQDEIASQVNQVRTRWGTTLKVYNPDDFIDEGLEKKGIAGINEKADGNKVGYAGEAVAVSRNTQYWDKVPEHERAHQLDQAKEFDMGSISYGEPPVTVAVIPDLTEWGAITRAGQTEAELVTSYVGYKRAGDALVAFLGNGGEEKLFAALKSGNMSVLQQAIDEKMADQVRRKVA